MISPIIGYGVVNLARRRLGATYPTYSLALAAAAELERLTGQLHGVQRTER